jgi:hypothetical protein
MGKAESAKIGLQAYALPFLSLVPLVLLRQILIFFFRSRQPQLRHHDPRPLPRLHSLPLPLYLRSSISYFRLFHPRPRLHRQPLNSPFPQRLLRHASDTARQRRCSTSGGNGRSIWSASQAGGGGSRRAGGTAIWTLLRLHLPTFSSRTFSTDVGLTTSG